MWSLDSAPQIERHPFFVWSYAVKMRGGYLRFQAQYLRRIRVPRPETLPQKLQREIHEAFRHRDLAALDTLALRAYGLDNLPTFDFVDTRMWHLLAAKGTAGI
jgi:hypothetical protein